MDGHSELALRRQNASDPAAAAHPHLLSQSDFRRHHESQLDGIAFRNLKIGVEERTTSAQILGEAATFALGPCQANSNRKLEVKALRRATLKVNLIGAHGLSDTWRSNIKWFAVASSKGIVCLYRRKALRQPNHSETPGQADVEHRLLYSKAERGGSWKLLPPIKNSSFGYQGRCCLSCGQHLKQRDWE
jgi:hypothetical protein